MSGKNEFLRGKPVDAGGEQAIRLIFKAVTLLVIFAGIWAGTQRFTFLVSYNEGWCGKPFYILSLGTYRWPLYHPFKLFYWALIY